MEPPVESYHCPACGELLAAPAGQLVQCPHCGEQFFTPDPDAAQSPEENEADDASRPAVGSEAELSELRIRQVSDLRRGAYRARSWCIISAACCVIGAAQLVQMTVHAVARGRVALPIGFCLAALAALMGGGYFVARAVELTGETRQSAIPPPAQPPDFSTLEDGTQHIRGLEEQSGGRASEAEREGASET